MTRDLTPEERTAIDRALKGYLSDLKRQFQDGVRTDYYIFPGGHAFGTMCLNAAAPAAALLHSCLLYDVHGPICPTSRSASEL